MLRAGAGVFALLLVAACQPGSVGPPEAPRPGTPSASASATASPSATPPRPAVAPSPPPAFAGIDWTRIAVPGSACFSSSSIQLRPAPFVDMDKEGNETLVPQGEAFIPSSMGYPKDPSGDGPRYVHLTDTPTTITYGRFGAEGQVPVAAVELLCDNNGGTAAGQLLFSIAVYTVSHDALRLLGLITPKQEPRNASHVTLIHTERLASAGLTVSETWYGPEDATCCPTGEATSSWQYEAGSLRHVETRVTKRPK